MHTASKKPAAGLAKDDEDVRVQSTNDEATIARACVSLPHHHHRTPFFLFPLFSLSSRNFWKLSAARVKVNLLSNCFSLSSRTRKRRRRRRRTTVRARPRVTYRTTFGLHYSSTRNTLAETNRCTTWAHFTESRTCGKRSRCF